MNEKDLIITPERTKELFKFINELPYKYAAPLANFFYGIMNESNIEKPEIIDNEHS